MLTIDEMYYIFRAALDRAEAQGHSFNFDRGKTWHRNTGRDFRFHHPNETLLYGVWVCQKCGRTLSVSGPNSDPPLTTSGQAAKQPCYGRRGEVR
jgi:hypothetical protein